MAKYLDDTELALQARDYPGACQNIFLFGIVAQSAIGKLSPAQRLAQYEETWRGMGSPENIAWFDLLGWANFDAGQFAAAEKFASKIEAQAAD